MANNNIQFNSSTLKYEKDSKIKGSDCLYCFQFTTGTNRDLRQELVNYSAKKRGLNDLVKNDTERKTIGESFWGIFKKPEGQSYELFVEDVKKSKVGFIGSSPIIPTGRDIPRVDMNGNLLVATINSNLQSYTDCGNMLISGEGEVIRAPKPSMIINAVDKKTGYYLVEIYKMRENKETGNQEVVGREYNFLDPNGKMLDSTQNFESTDSTQIFEVSRCFYMKDGKSVINDRSVYPVAYVVTTWKQPELFESAIQLIEENRRRVAEGELPIIENEQPLLKSYFLRKRELEGIVRYLVMKFDAGKMTQKMYDEVMQQINYEYSIIDDFESNHKTEADARLETELFGEMEK